MPEPTHDRLVMSATREAVEGGFAQLQSQLNLIERTGPENPGLVFDLARGLIEGTCRRILEERGAPPSKRDDVPDLFRRVTRTLPILPPSASQAADVRRSIVQTINGLNTAVQGICELRNQLGVASHVAAEPPPELGWTHAKMAANTADAVVGFLFRVHTEDRVPQRAPRYGDNEAFNQWIDAFHDTVHILEAEFPPSLVLHTMDTEAYRVRLAEFSAEDEETEQDQ